MKIEKEILRAFRNGNSVQLTKRDRVQPCKYTLWGNPVVSLVGGRLVLRNCGWNTRTTANRLNAFLAEFNSKKGGHSVAYRYAGNGGFYADGVKIADGCIAIDPSTGEFIE